MPFLTDLLSYGVEVNWRLMWLPVRAAARLAAVEVRTDSFRLARSEVPPPHDGWIYKPKHDLGQGQRHGDPLGYPDDPVVAFLAIGTGTSRYLEADIELRVGTATSRTMVIVEPSVRTPFMLSVHAPGDGYLADTAAVVDGVFNAGGRVKLSDLMKFVR
jgi:hypothetical protein